jgi:23S rRNA (cytidine1920-2'-O)/16S rRNA (cytidine1409-2'-O)-methyltransferase
MTRPVALAEREPYVSRGGHKLAAALDAFGIDPAGLVCLDVGASTGGFTDVLLQRGATRVYAVDVGRGQLAEALKRDGRVVSMERVNARTLTANDARGADRPRGRRCLVHLARAGPRSDREHAPAGCQGSGSWRS